VIATLDSQNHEKVKIDDDIFTPQTPAPQRLPKRPARTPLMVVYTKKQ
jgi:hypothetical protein